MGLLKVRGTCLGDPMILMKALGRSMLGYVYFKELATWTGLGPDSRMTSYKGSRIEVYAAGSIGSRSPKGGVMTP